MARPSLCLFVLVICLRHVIPQVSKRSTESKSDPQCPISVTVVQGGDLVCTGALLFSEDFNISGLKNLSNWQVEIMFPEKPDYPFNAYIPDGTLSIQEGSLVITPVLTESQFHEEFLNQYWDLGERCTKVRSTTECIRQASGPFILPPVMTGKITTRHKFDFKFGRVEVRAKLPAGSWLIPEINLEPTNNVYGYDHYESGLMRIAFARGNPSEAKKLYGGPVLSDKEPFRSQLLKEKLGIDDWNLDYHNYTMIWKPDGIQLFVDGEEYGNINPGAGFYESAHEHAVAHASKWIRGHVMAPLDQMFHLSLGLRVGGIHDFPDDLPDKPWKNLAIKSVWTFWKSKDSWLPSWNNSNMKVDYIRVYALNIVEKGPRGYRIPTPKVEAFYPQGFRVTLIDDNYSLFGFRGNINKRLDNKNEGDIHEDLMKPKRGTWIYKNIEEELEIGDTIYYWIYVIRNGNAFMTNTLEYTVHEYLRPPGQPTSSDPKPDLEITELSQASCTPSKTVVQGRKSVCKDALIFNEEFDKTSLRALSNWKAETMFPGEPDQPFNVYIPDDTVTFEDGALVITPVLIESKYREGFVYEALDLNFRCTGKYATEECQQEGSGGQILPPVITGKITTRQSFNFKFGRVEVRAKLPGGSWVIPEINLEPLDYKYGFERYDSGLMRVAFARGNPSLAKKLYGGPLLSDMEPFRSLLLKEKIGIENWHQDFHNYTMIWRPDSMELLVDGQQYGVINPGEGFYKVAKENKMDGAVQWLFGTVMAPLDQMFYLTLGVRVGGINDFDDDLEGKPWKNGGSKARLDFWNNRQSWLPSWYDGAMKIDYVKVYAL